MLADPEMPFVNVTGIWSQVASSVPFLPDDLQNEPTRYQGTTDETWLSLLRTATVYAPCAIQKDL